MDGVAPLVNQRDRAKLKLNRLGVDGVCEAICSEKSLTQIALEAGVSVPSLLVWIEADPERSARVREARRIMARMWDEKAERLIGEATDEFELKKAKELAHHYRWRAAKIAPKEYGDKVELSSDPLAPIVPPRILVVGVEPRRLGQTIDGEASPAERDV